MNSFGSSTNCIDLYKAIVYVNIVFTLTLRVCIIVDQRCKLIDTISITKFIDIIFIV